MWGSQMFYAAAGCAEGDGILNQAQVLSLRKRVTCHSKNAWLIGAFGCNPSPKQKKQSPVQDQDSGRCPHSPPFCPSTLLWNTPFLMLSAHLSAEVEVKTPVCLQVRCPPLPGTVAQDASSARGPAQKSSPHSKPPMSETLCPWSPWEVVGQDLNPPLFQKTSTPPCVLCVHTC